MQIGIPKIYNNIDNKNVLNILENNFKTLSHYWLNFNFYWLNNAYKKFNDHEKYLIFIFLISKTLNFYSKQFIKLSFEQYYSKKKVETENFNTIEVSKKLKIPKESTRRKILELEKSGIIMKLNKKIIFNKDSFHLQKPIKTVKSISFLLSQISKILSDNNILKKKVSSEIIEKHILSNFTHCWKFFFEMHIPNLVNWKNFFGNLETLTIFGACTVNQNLELKKTFKEKEKIFSNKVNYLENLTRKNIIKQRQGINAMSISEISGIPRATVVRKLKLLLKNKFLFIDDRKLYYVNNKSIKDTVKLQTDVLKSLSIFVTKIFNGITI